MGLKMFLIKILHPNSAICLSSVKLSWFEDLHISPENPFVLLEAVFK